MDSANIRRFFESRNSGYVNFHLPRYLTLFEKIAQDYVDGARILDVGQSAFTNALAAAFGRVDILDFQHEQHGETGTHYQFDLNTCHDRSTWRDDLPDYDIIVFAEVIEHLPTSPSHVLAFLHNLLRDGGRLFLQTPNAAVLGKRLKLLAGRNPFELIRDNAQNPGHFREYTFSEIETYLISNGFEIEYASYQSYFDYEYVDHSAEQLVRDRSKYWINMLYRTVPPSFRPGMFFVARKR